MKKNRFMRMASCFALIALSGGGCGSGAGGVEAGNPSQLVIGSLTSSNDAALDAVSPSCGADRAVASDSLGRSFAAKVAEDCSFELDLPVPEAYRLDFLVGADTIASMSFDNSSKRFLAPVMNLSPGGGTIYLNRVTLKGGEATPSNEPSAQNDQNENGVPDLFDDDDDGDGIADEDEADCDLDGIIDDFDEDSSACSPGSGGNTALEVSPRNGEGTGAHGSKVKTGEDVTIRFSCPIDPATALPSSLLIFPDNDPSNVLACSLTLIGSGKQLRCGHAGFLTNTVYDARLEGVRCDDGSEVPAVSWSWKTH